MNKVQKDIENMKKIHNHVLNFIDKENDQEELFQNIKQEIQNQNISTDSHLFKTFLYMLSKILNNHYRYPNFFAKIEKIILQYKTEIKQKFKNSEIYKIFEKSPKFLLFLIKEKIIEIDEETFEIMLVRTFIYLFPQIAFTLKKLSEIPTNYEEKQRIGENDDPISQMIREDSIEEFITYVNKNEYPLNSYIKKSNFETNDFLIKHNETRLIEYAAFFGSTQIFKYLYKNGVELTSSLWLYGIHSDNAEMIHLLEENEVEPPNQSYEECIKESIKCHHNDIFNYLQSNYLNEDIKSIDDIDFKQCYDENIYSYSYHYYNFSHFPHEMNNKINFYYACQYDYFQIVEYFLKTVKININEKIIQIISIFLQNLN